MIDFLEAYLGYTAIGEIVQLIRVRVSRASGRCIQSIDFLEVAVPCANLLVVSENFPIGTAHIVWHKQILPLLMCAKPKAFFDRHIFVEG
jgi:hypothetical protein